MPHHHHPDPPPEERERERKRKKKKRPHETDLPVPGGGTEWLVKTLKGIAPSTTLEIPPGIYDLPNLELVGLRNVTLQGKAGTVITGAGFSFADILNLALLGLTFRNYGQCYVQGGTGFRAENCDFDGSRHSGIVTAWVSKGRIIGCKSRNHKDHGFYPSEGGDDWEISGNTIENCQRAGVHCNAVPKRGRNYRVVGNTILNCRSAAIQFAGIQGGVIAENTLKGNGKEITLWDDGAGAAYACRDIDLTRQIAKHVQVGAGCENIRLPAGM